MSSKQINKQMARKQKEIQVDTQTDLQVDTRTGKQKIKMRPYVLLLLKYLNNK